MSTATSETTPAATPEQPKRDFRQEVTDRIITSSKMGLPRGRSRGTRLKHRLAYRSIRQRNGRIAAAMPYT